MKEVMKTEFYKTFRSKLFWGMFVALTAILLTFFLAYVHDGTKDGYTLFLMSLKDNLSLLEFLCPIFAGIHIASAFENRTVQAGIMAGHSRFSVLFAKLLSYCAAIGVFVIGAVTVLGGIAFILFDSEVIEGGIFTGIIVRACVYMLTVISCMTICFVISIFIKNMGAAITVNFFALLLLTSVGQELVGKENLTDIMHHTSVGQSVYLLMENDISNMIGAAFTAIASIMVLFAVAYMKFRKEELK